MKIDCSVISCVRESYVRIGKPESVMLAYSGGADSTSLLYALLKLREKEGFSLVCAHVNHQIRSASIYEEQWITDRLSGFGVPLIIKRIHVPKKGNLESNAREARYHALHEAMNDRGCEVLALAHHANDQAETMLMRLMHGTGLKGLSGMSELSGALWRPLLQLTRATLIGFLNAQKAEWIQDESNSDPSFMRNSIRMNLIHRIESESPGACERMAQTAVILQDENSAWRSYEDDWLEKNARMEPPFVYLLTERLCRESAALQRRLIRRLCDVYNLALDFRQTETVRGLVDSTPGTGINLPGGAKAFRSKNRLHILADAVESMHPDWPQPTVLELKGSHGDGKRVQTFDARQVSGASVRQAKPGDWIIPFGMTGSMSLAKYLGSRGVDRPFRRFWPVLARGNEIIWAIGIGPSQTAAITPGTEQSICLAFDARLPDE